MKHAGGPLVLPHEAAGRPPRRDTVNPQAVTATKPVPPEGSSGLAAGAGAVPLRDATLVRPAVAGSCPDGRTTSWQGACGSIAKERAATPTNSSGMLLHLNSGTWGRVTANCRHRSSSPAELLKARRVSEPCPGKLSLRSIRSPQRRRGISPMENGRSNVTTDPIQNLLGSAADHVQALPQQRAAGLQFR